MKAIVFDIDGTLVESMAVDTELYFASIRAVLGPVSVRRRLDDYDNVSDSGILAQILEDNDRPMDEPTMAAVQASFIDRLAKHIEVEGPFPPIDGAVRFLDRARETDDTRVAIATGGWRSSALLKLESAGFDVEGIPLTTSDDSPVRADIMRLALHAMGNHFESITYFGDAEWDQRACDALGWRFVAVGPGLGGITSYDGIEL